MHSSSAKGHRRSPQFHYFAIGVSLMALLGAVADAQEIVTTENAKCIAKLPPNRQQFEQELGSGLRLIFRKPNSREPDRYFLVTSDHRSGHCDGKREWDVLSVLTIPHLMQGQWSGASFDCRAPKGVVKKDQVLIGIFSTAENSIPTHAARAWTVVSKDRNFKEVFGARCLSFDK